MDPIRQAALGSLARQRIQGIGSRPIKKLPKKLTSTGGKRLLVHLQRLMLRLAMPYKLPNIFHIDRLMAYRADIAGYAIARFGPVLFAGNRRSKIGQFCHQVETFNSAKMFREPSRNLHGCGTWIERTATTNLLSKRQLI